VHECAPLVTANIFLPGIYLQTAVKHVIIYKAVETVVGQADKSCVAQGVGLFSHNKIIRSL
jgi:hypothetical protein